MKILEIIIKLINDIFYYLKILKEYCLQDIDEEDEEEEEEENEEEEEDEEKENEEEKIIVSFGDNRYDISSFIFKHPGGEDLLIDNNGKNIEELMLENNHSDRAYKLLEKYKID